MDSPISDQYKKPLSDLLDQSQTTSPAKKKENAINRGAELLGLFSRKKATPPVPRQQSGNNENIQLNGNDNDLQLKQVHAVIQGNIVGQLYSEQKRKLENKLLFGEDLEEDVENTVRRVITELNQYSYDDSFDDRSKHIYQKLRELLKKVCEKFDCDSYALNSLDYAKRINFSPAEAENGMKSVSLLKTAEKAVLKNYMRNQLELQETEYSEYEENFNRIIDELKSQNDELLASNNHLIDENFSLKQELDEELRKKKALGVEFDNRVSEVTRLTNERDEILKELHTLQSKLEQAEELKVLVGEEKSILNNYMNNQLDLQNSELQQYEEVINSLQDSIEQYKTDLENAESLSTERNERIKVLEGLLNDAKIDFDAQLGGIEAAYNEMKKSIQSLENDKFSTLQENKSLQETINELNQKIQSLSEDYNQERLALETALFKFEREYDDLLPKYHHLLKEFDNNSQTIVEWESKYNVLESDRSHLLNEVQDLRRQLDEQNDVLSSDLVEKVKILEQVKSESDELKLTNSNLIEELQILKNELKDKLADIDKLEETREHLTAERNDFFAEITELQDTNSMLATKLENADNLVLEYRSRLADLEEESNSLKVSESNLHSSQVSKMSELTEAYHQIETQEKQIELLEIQKTELEATLKKRDDVIARMNAAVSGEAIASKTSPNQKGSVPSPWWTNSRDSFDDSEKLYHSFENKLKVQIAQLQSLQDSYTEEKRKCELLQNQKQSLTSKLTEQSKYNEDIERQLSELKGREVNRDAEISYLKNQLSEANDRVSEFALNLKESEQKLLSTKNLLESLQLQNTSLRQTVLEKDHEILHIHHNLESISESTPSLLQTPTRNNERILQAKIEALGSKIKSLEQEKSELAAFRQAAEENCMYKSERIDELTKELNRLRSIVTVKSNEYESLRASALSEQARLEAILSEKEKTLENLRDILLRSEQAVKDIEELSNQRLAALIEQQDTNGQLRNLLLIVSEKENATEDLVREVQDADKTLRNKVKNLQENLANSQAEIIELKKQLFEKSVEIQEISKKYREDISISEQNLRALQDDSKLASGRADTMEKDVDKLQATLNKRTEDLAQLVKERDSLKMQLQQLVFSTQNEKTGGINNTQFLVKSLKEFSSLFENKADGLESCVNKWIDGFAYRITETELFVGKVKGKLSHYAYDMASMKQKVADLEFESKRGLQLRMELESQISLSQEEVKKLQLRSERNVSELDSSRLMRSIDVLKEEMEKSNIMHLVETRSAVSDEVAVSKVFERVEIIENRVVDISAGIAKLNVRHAKEVAYLKEESDRLRHLLDHFRMVNTKLLGDIKIAQSNGLATISQSNKSIFFNVELESVQKQLENVTNLLAAKENECFKLNKYLSQHAESVASQYDMKFNSLIEEISTKENRIFELENEIHLLKNANSDLIEQLTVEKNDLDDLVSQYKSDFAEEKSKTETLIIEVRKLNSANDSLERKNADALHKISVLENTFSESKSSFERSKSSLEESLDAQLKKAGQMLNEINELKNVIDELKGDNERKELTVSALHERLALSTEELKEVNIKLGELEKINAQLQSENSLEKHKSADLLKLLDGTKETIVRLESEGRQIEVKLRKAEEYNNKSAKVISNLEAQLEDLKAQNVSVLETSTIQESKAEDLVSALKESQYQQESLKRKIQSYNDDFRRLTDEVNNSESIIASQEHSLELLRQELQESESKVVKLQNLLSSTELKVDDLHKENQSFRENQQKSQSELDQLTEKILNFMKSTMTKASSQKFGLDLLDTPVKDFNEATGYGQRLTITNTFEMSACFSRLCTAVDDLINSSSSLSTSLVTVNKSLNDTMRTSRTQEQKWNELYNENSLLKSRFDQIDHEFQSCTESLSLITQERDDLILELNENAKNMRLLKRDIESIITAESVQNAIAQAVGLLDENSQTSLELFDTLSRSGILTEYNKSSNILSTSLVETEVTIKRLCQYLQATAAAYTEKQKQYLRLEDKYIHQRQDWEEEKQFLNSRVINSQNTIEAERLQLAKVKGDLNAYAEECKELKLLVAEYSQKNLEYDDIIQHVNESTSELKTALREAEDLCVDLKEKILKQQREIDDGRRDLSVSQDELSLAKKKISSLELLLEQNSAALGRAKAEKDAINDVRQSLQAEYDTLRAELNQLRGKLRTQERIMDNAAKYDLERILVAVAATMDHIGIEGPTLSTPEKTKESSSADSLVEGQLIDQPDSRIDREVKRLSTLRSWYREEKRGKKVAEDKIALLEQSLETLRNSLEAEKANFQKTLKERIESERTISKRLTEQLTVRTSRTHIEESKDDAAGYDRMHEKKLIAELEGTLSIKEADLIRATMEKTELSNKYELLQKTQQHEIDKFNVVLAELKEKESLIKSLKHANNDLASKLDKTELMLEKARLELVDKEKKMIELNRDQTQQMQIIELENILQQIKLEAGRNENLKQDQLQSAAMEILELKEKESKLESKHHQLIAENNKLKKDNQLLTAEITKLQTKLTKESVELNKLQNTVESLKSQEETLQRKANDWENTIRRLEERYELSEDKNRKLQEALDRYHSEQRTSSLSLTRYEESSNVEKEKRLHLENELRRNVDSLERLQKEYTVLSTRSSALRSEGRKARQELSELRSQLIEILYDMRGFGLHTGVTSDSMHIDPASFEESKQENEDTFGVSSLRVVMSNLKKVSSAIQSLGKPAAVTKHRETSMEQEVNRLQSELQAKESSYQSKVTMLTEELHNLENQIKIMRKKESGDQVSFKQIQALESENFLLKERIARASEKEAKLMSEMVEMSRREASIVNDTLNFSVTSTNHELANNLEQEGLRKEITLLRQELAAVANHRTSLQETVNKLENMLNEDYHVNYSSNEFTFGVSEAGATVDSAKGISATAYKRLLNRLNLFESIAALYRKGYISTVSSEARERNLRTIGSSISQEASLIVLDNSKAWYEKEINLIVSSFKTEMKWLETELEEIRSHLNQSHAYNVEIVARLEDTMRSLYRSGKGQLSATLSHQLEHLSTDLQTANKQVNTLQKQLSTSTTQSRRQHERLIDELSSLVKIRNSLESNVKSFEEQLRKYENEASDRAKADGREIEKLRSTLTSLEAADSQLKKVVAEKDLVIQQLRSSLVQKDDELEVFKNSHKRIMKAHQQTSLHQHQQQQQQSSQVSSTSASVAADSVLEQITESYRKTHHKTVDPLSPPPAAESRKRNVSMTVTFPKSPGESSSKIQQSNKQLAQAPSAYPQSSKPQLSSKFGRDREKESSIPATSTYQYQSPVDVRKSGKNGSSAITRSPYGTGVAHKK